MLTLFMMLQLLVAIMGGTFNRLKETEENNKWKEVAGMMVENEKLMNRTRKFAKAKYIIVVI